MTAEKRRGRLLKRVLAVAFVVMAFLFLGMTVAANLEDLRDFRWDVRPGVLFLSLLGVVGAFLWGIFVWQIILRYFGAPAAFGPLARIWFITNLGKYIPGKIWQLVGVAQMGMAFGLSPTLSVTSLVIQMVFTVVAGLAVVALFLPAEAALNGDWLPILRWSIVPIVLILVHPRLMRAGLVLVRRMTRRELAPWQGSWFDGIMLLLLSLVSWLVYGAAFHLFLAAFVPVPIEMFGTIVAINALAFLIGYAVFIAPAGLGAKEGALAALLALYFPVGVAAAMSIAARLWTVAGEVIPALVVLPLGRPSCEPPPDAPT